MPIKKLFIGWATILCSLLMTQGVVATLPIRDSSALPSSLPGFQKSSRALLKESSFPTALDVAVKSIPRGGDNMVVTALDGLKTFVSGGRADSILLLLTTALNTPVCQKLGISPILGFLALGTLFGQQGMISDMHTTEEFADFGIVLFLFEMGIHLDFKTLMAMKKDVFGIGLSQFTVTGIAIAAACKLLFGLSTAAAVVIGWSLALSSSAFVLQLLKDTNQMESQYGKSSFGTLLLQDIMVVPLLVITPLLAGGDQSVSEAVKMALLQVVMALSSIAAFGKFLLAPFFDLVASSMSQEAMVGALLSTVFGMSFLTQGLGLSNTLGAFLSGMLLSETKHKHAIEVEANPFRGILVGIFFVTVGFEIDIPFIISNWKVITSIVAGILAAKATIATAVCRVFGLDMATARHVGLVLSQGGEFAFVAFRSARAMGILDKDITKVLLTCVALTMALTPPLEGLGASLAIESKDAKGKKKK